MAGKKRAETKSKATNKKTNQTKLSPEVAEADKLRLAALRAGRRATKLRKTAYAEFAAAKTSAEKDKVRAQYSEELRNLKFKADKAFTAYRCCLEENFGRGLVDKIQFPDGLDGDFIPTTDKKFINDLQKAKSLSMAKKTTTPKKPAAGTKKSAAQKKTIIPRGKARK